MKLVYIACPVRGNIGENLKNASRYCEYVANCGHIPISPAVAWQGFLPEDIPGNRDKALAMGLKLLEYCSELWCMGDEISQGMQAEIEAAEKLGKPVIYVLREQVEKNIKIRQMLEPLGIDACIPGSREQDYENKTLVLDSKSLIPSARHMQNSLWYALSGFGCTYGARGQAVVARNLFDGRTAQWERSDFHGIIKPEVLAKWLEDTPVVHELTQATTQDDGLEM
jgi:hypothetical protein